MEEGFHGPANYTRGVRMKKYPFVIFGAAGIALFSSMGFVGLAINQFVKDYEESFTPDGISRP